MTPEAIVRGFVYAIAAMSLLAAAVWWGWEMRTRLALKLEHFRLTNREWSDYDAALRAKGGPHRAELHSFRERQSDR